MSCLSRGFSHFYKQAFPDVESKKFKVLRETYLSYLNKAVGDDTIELSSHGNMKILKRSFLFIQRQRKFKITSLSFFAFYPNFTVMFFNKFMTNQEP
jgi:hypothetical protein